MDSKAKSFCTTGEAAAILGVSVTTVQKLVSEGLLQAWKTHGGHRRIARPSIEKLMAGSAEVPGHSLLPEG